MAKLTDIADDLIFVPSEEQKKAKAAFWVAYTDLPLADLDNVSCAQAQQYSQTNKISKWWSVPSFKDWFLNKDEFRQEVEYLAQIALNTVREILTDPDVNPNARVNAAKLIMEVANKLPKNQQAPKFADLQIAQMTAEQLKAFINKNAQKSIAPQSKEDSLDASPN